MFQGTFPYHIDDKGRLKMPAEFVHGLGTSFTVTRGERNCLWVLPEAEWREMAAKLHGERLIDPPTLLLKRYFIGAAVTASLDAQGRLSLPGVLRDFAGIQHELVLVGTGERVEIWSRENWERYEAQVSPELLEEYVARAGL